MKHEHHTKEHHALCIKTAKQLIQAAHKMLEASQYEWTTVARPTLIEALAEIALARENVGLALEKVEKKELGPIDMPPISSPGSWPVSSS